MNFLPIAIGGAIIATIALGSVIKKWRSERKKKETTAVVASVIAGAGTKKDEGKKLTFGQQVRRWWLILIFGIPITYFLVLGMWGLVYRSVAKIQSSSHEISAVCGWKKKPAQYGYNPSERTGGPYDTVITKDDNNNFCFTVSTGGSIGHFYGKKKNGMIEGWWEQTNPRSGGKFNLRKDTGDPTLYTGTITDPSLLEGMYFELRVRY